MLRRLYSTFIDHFSPVSTIDIGFGPLSANISPSSFGCERLESLQWLHSTSPCFPLSAAQVELIQQPHVFYDKLLDLCTNAEQRISIASLYLGIGQLEKALVSRIHDNLKQNVDLKVNILLDFARGTRGELNSRSMLQELVDVSQNTTLSFYHTPNLRGLTKKLVPQRWNELIGLQHMKVYVADDTVILSGANLSNDYFTNRQDRYILIRDKRLSDFYHNLIAKVQEFSLNVNEHGSMSLHPKWKISPYAGAKNDFKDRASTVVRDYFRQLSELQSLQPPAAVAEADTWIFPLIEMGQLDIHHESVVTKRLFSSAVPGSTINLSTGYFNLTQEYMNTITKDCAAQCNILMAHPKANGFLGAKGPAGGIPAAYSQIAKTFYRHLVEAGQQKRVHLYEYQRDNWTYHAKGLWYYLPDSQLPDLTVIGSSNFGERSVNRDLESQICLVTTNDTLRQQLHSECDNLYKHGQVAERELELRPVPKWVRLVVALFRNYF